MALRRAVPVMKCSLVHHLLGNNDSHLHLLADCGHPNPKHGAIWNKAFIEAAKALIRYLQFFIGSWSVCSSEGTSFPGDHFVTQQIIVSKESLYTSLDSNF